MAETTQTTADIRYKDAPGKICFSPSGVWGGNNFQGQLVANLYVESRDFPPMMSIKVDHQKNVVTEITSAPTKLTFTREVQASIVFDADLAIVMGNWLIEQGTALRQKLGDRHAAKLERMPAP